MTEHRLRLSLLALAALVCGACAWLRDHPAAVAGGEAGLDQIEAACALVTNARDQRLCLVLAELGARAATEALEAALAASAAPPAPSCPVPPAPAPSSAPPGDP